MKTIFGLFHLFLHLFSKPACGWRAPHHKRHSCTVGNTYPRRARHTVSASAAKIPCKSRFVVFNNSADFFRHFRGIFHIAQKFVKLAHALDSPNRQYVIKLRNIGICCGGIVYKSAGKRFHGNKSHIVFPANFHKFNFTFAGKIAERKLQGFIKSGLCRFQRHADFVRCNSYMPYHSALFCLKHTLVHSGTVARSETLRRHMELINIKIICAQIVKGCFKVRPEFFWSLCMGLACNIDFAAHIRKSFADFFFAVGISSCGIEKSHSAVVRLAKNFHRRFHVVTLYRQCAECILLNGDSG